MKHIFSSTPVLTFYAILVILVIMITTTEKPIDDPIYTDDMFITTTINLVLGGGSDTERHCVMLRFLDKTYVNDTINYVSEINALEQELKSKGNTDKEIISNNNYLELEYMAIMTYDLRLIIRNSKKVMACND